MSTDATPGGYSTVEVDGFTFTGNTQTAEEMRENLTPEDKDPVKEAARTLGEKGGKAAAEARKAKPDDGTRVDEPAGAGDSDLDAPAEPDKPLGKPRDDPKARVAQALREKKEAEEALRIEREELAAERRERQRLEALHREKPEERQAPKEADPRPKAEDFDDHDEYTLALSRWGARQEFSEARKRAAIEGQAQAYTRGIYNVTSKAAERVEAARKADPDWDSKISDDVWSLDGSFNVPPGERPTVRHWMGDEILLSDKGPELMLFLSEHPEQAQRIASLRTQREVAREMAKLEDKLEGKDAVTAGTSSKPPVSTAKPPVRPVTGSPSTAEPDDDSLSDDAYISRAMNRARR